MDLVRRFASIVLVGFAALCIAIWGVWYNENLRMLVADKLPFRADAFPAALGGPEVGPIVFALIVFAGAYFVYPPAEKEE